MLPARSLRALRRFTTAPASPASCVTVDLKPAGVAVVRLDVPGEKVS